ncbi:MAG: hypothetical protein J6X53_08845 [Abditibacteriota bacterium]|nr:hypothetical protein [Abditibacteriota bacterium]MBP5719063.1 hypothetical protein [Abditibacteriota bacterium]
MKKFMFVIALIAVTAGSVFAGWVKDYNEATAAIDGTATILAGPTGEGGLMNVNATYSNVQNGTIPYQLMNGSFGIVALLKDENAPQDASDLYLRLLSTEYTFDDIYFAVYVDDPVITPALSFNVWGANAANVQNLIGQEWYVYVNGDYVDSFVWDGDHTKKATPMYTYAFDVNDIAGMTNAAVLRLSTTAPEEPETEVPEPAAFAYAAMGLVSAFGLKRRIRK